MGAKFSKMIFGDRHSTVRNRSNSEDQELPHPIRRPFNKNYKLPKTSIKQFHGKSSILNIRNSSSNNNIFGNVQVSNPKTQYLQQIGPAQTQYSPAGQVQASSAQASSARQYSPQQPQTRSLMNKIRGREINTNKKLLNINIKKKDIFSLLNKNTTFVLQRHATSCANIINKGFETGSTSYLAFGKSRLVAEIAPDSMLSSVGIDECNQVHDYLTNLGTEIIKLDRFEHLFCCSELFRTQQTMFLSYFELIDEYNIKIMILPWLNEERAVGGVNKDNLTISLKETKKRWSDFIEQQILKFPLLEKLKTIIDTRSNTVFIPGNKINKEEKEKLITQVRKIYGINGDITIQLIEKKIKEEKEKYSKFLDWENVFDLPDFIYRTPKGLEATFDKRVDLEKLYKIKMEESKIGLTRTKQSYNADDLLFALPFILYLSEKAADSQKELKIFMTGHSRTMVKLINLITLRSASNLDLRSMIKKGVNKIKGVKMITGDKSPYYSKPSLEKQQMMNAEIIQLEPVNLRRVFGDRDKFEKFEHLKSSNINDLSNKSSNNNQEIINKDFNLCRKFPVGFSEHLISKQLKDETFKKISPFYFFYNSDLQIVYSLVDIIEQKIQTSNDKLYKEGYPLRVFFGMTLLQYVGYLMVAKLVVSKMKDEFTKNPKYDYQGLLDKISELDKKIHEYVGDTGNVNSRNNLNPEPSKNLAIGNSNAQSQSSASNPKLSGNEKYSNLKKGGDPTPLLAFKYMEEINMTKYYVPKARQFSKYRITIKQFLFDTLPELKDIPDRQLKRTKFVELLHTSLLSTCKIKPEQKNKITTFMKNSFPTGLLEQESQTPTRGFNEQGQGMLERVQKLNEKIGSYLLKDSGYLIVPFNPLSSDGQNQLDKIIEHMKKMGGFYLKTFEGRIYSEQTKISRANEIYNDLNSRTGIYPLLKLMYPSINDSVGKYIVGMIYKILITYTNYNFGYPQITKYLVFLLIIIYINYGIQYLLDFLKKAYIIFSVIENFNIPDIINRILRDNKKNYSILTSRYMFFSDQLISAEIQFPHSDIPYNKGNLNQFKALITRKKRNYSIEEKILNIKRYYYYVSYFYNEDVKKYYEKYGLIFLYFSLYIPDLIYYISDSKDFNKEITNIKNENQYKINYAKKIQYLFKLSDNEIKNKSIAVIDEFLPKLINYIKTFNSNNYNFIGESNINLNIDKLYDKIMGRLLKSNTEQVRVKNDDYSANNSTNNSKKKDFEINFKKVIELITEPVHFESNEKAIATISGIPAKFEQSLISPHFFAFEFNLNKIKEVCLKGLMKFSKKNCIEFVKADISNIMECVKQLFHTEIDIWKYFVEIHIRLIKEGYVFVNTETTTIIYISRLFGSSFDSILEIFYQSFPYLMFCFEYVSIIAREICNILISPCQILNNLFDTIGLEKMIILYKYLNITNIEVMEYIKKYGIIFLIYALLTPFHMCQIELTGKNISLHEQIIIDKLKAMEKYELIKRVKLVFDDKKIIEFIQKVGEKKNEIFGKVPVVQNNSNSNLNLTKFSNTGNKYNFKNPAFPNMDKTEPIGQNAEFIWSCFTELFVQFVPFVPITVDGNRNVLDEIIAFYKRGHGVYKKNVIEQINKDYTRNKVMFYMIYKKYLRINDDTKIRELYNSFWKIIVEDYGNLNIEFSQRANIILWIPLFYKYNKLDFFKNIYLVNSLNLEAFTASEFMKYILKATVEQYTDDNWEYFRYTVIGCDIITNIFQQKDLTFYENNNNVNKLKLFLYYIIEYNNPDVKEYYENHGLIFFYFILILPNIMLYEYTKNNSEFKKYGIHYNRTPADEKKKDIDFIMKYLNNETTFKKISNLIIDKYIGEFKNYINSLNTKLKLGNVSDNANKNKTMIFVNNGQNNSVKAKYSNSSNSLETRTTPEPKQVDIYTTLLMKRVYFAT